MNSGRFFTEVTTVGGSQKAEAIQDAAEKLHAAIE